MKTNGDRSLSIHDLFSFRFGYLRNSKIFPFSILLFLQEWWSQPFDSRPLFFQVSMSPEFDNLSVFNTTFSAGGRRGWGGVSGQRRHPPPPGENVPAISFFRNGKRLSQGPHFRRTTTIWSTTSPWWMASLGQFFNVCVNWGLWDNLYLPRTTPDKHVELSSVCVSPPGATSSRLDGPSEKVQVRKPWANVSKRNQGGFRAMD